MTEGYIKFNPQWIKEPVTIGKELLADSNKVRSALIGKGYLGVLPNGIGFGNISVRDGNTNRFYITGSATGGIPVLEASHMALVEQTDIKNNSLVCHGLTAASSESMSHAIIYLTNTEVHAVIHIHQAKLWNKYLHQLPTTDPLAEFGTPEMAFSIERLIKKIQSSSAVLIMAGHEDGLIAYAGTLQLAFKQLLMLK